MLTPGPPPAWTCFEEGSATYSVMVVSERVVHERRCVPLFGDDRRHGRRRIAVRTAARARRAR